MNSIIQYLLIQNQYLLQIISFLFKFICKHIPLKQWIFNDSNSPEYQKFKVDGYSAYILAAQQFFIKKENAFKFDITQVIGLTNDDAVSAEFRPFKQLVERLNRTFKASYRVKLGEQ